MARPMWRLRQRARCAATAVVAALITGAGGQPEVIKYVPDTGFERVPYTPFSMLFEFNEVVQAGSGIVRVDTGSSENIKTLGRIQCKDGVYIDKFAVLPVIMDLRPSCEDDVCEFLSPRAGDDACCALPEDGTCVFDSNAYFRYSYSAGESCGGDNFTTCCRKELGSYYSMTILQNCFQNTNGEFLAGQIRDHFWSSIRYNHDVTKFDVDAPSILDVTLTTPALDSYVSAGVAPSFTLFFSEAVQMGPAPIQILQSSGSLGRRIIFDDRPTVAFDVSIPGKVTIHMHRPFEANRGYELYFDGGAFMDNAGNPTKSSSKLFNGAFDGFMLFTTAQESAELSFVKSPRTGASVTPYTNLVFEFEHHVSLGPGELRLCGNWSLENPCETFLPVAASDMVVLDKMIILNPREDLTENEQYNVSIPGSVFLYFEGIAPDVETGAFEYSFTAEGIDIDPPIVIRSLIDCNGDGDVYDVCDSDGDGVDDFAELFDSVSETMAMPITIQFKLFFSERVVFNRSAEPPLLMGDDGSVMPVKYSVGEGRDDFIVTLDPDLVPARAYNISVAAGFIQDTAPQKVPNHFAGTFFAFYTPMTPPAVSLAAKGTVHVAKTTAIRFTFATVPHINLSCPNINMTITEISGGFPIEIISFDNEDKVKFLDREIVVLPEKTLLSGTTYQMTVPQYSIMYLIFDFTFNFTTRVEDVMKPSIVYAYPQGVVPSWKLNQIAPYILFSEGVQAGIAGRIFVKEDGEIKYTINASKTSCGFGRSALDACAVLHPNKKRLVIYPSGRLRSGIVAPWASPGRTYTIDFENGSFSDAVTTGSVRFNEMDRSSFSFQSHSDGLAPVLLSSEPRNRSSGVSADLKSVFLTFDEQIHIDKTYFAIYTWHDSGGAPTLVDRGGGLAPISGDGGSTVVVLNFDTAVQAGSEGGFELYQWCNNTFCADNNIDNYENGSVIPAAAASFVDNLVLFEATSEHLALPGMPNIHRRRYPYHVRSLRPGTVRDAHTGKDMSASFDTSESPLVRFTPIHMPGRVVFSTLDEYSCLPGQGLPDIEIYMDKIATSVAYNVSGELKHIKLQDCSSDCTTGLPNMTHWTLIADDANTTDMYLKVALDPEKKYKATLHTKFLPRPILGSVHHPLQMGAFYQLVLESGLFENHPTQKWRAYTTSTTTTTTTSTITTTRDPCIPWYTNATFASNDSNFTLTNASFDYFNTTNFSGNITYCPQAEMLTTTAPPDGNDSNSTNYSSSSLYDAEDLSDDNATGNYSNITKRRLSDVHTFLKGALDGRSLPLSDDSLDELPGYWQESLHYSYWYEEVSSPTIHLPFRVCDVHLDNVHSNRVLIYSTFTSTTGGKRFKVIVPPQAVKDDVMNVPVQTQHVSFALDQHGPRLSLKSSFPPHNGEAARQADLVLSFNENIQAGRGYFSVWDFDANETSRDSDVLKFNVDVAKIVSSSSDGHALISGNKLSITPRTLCDGSPPCGDLEDTRSYYITTNRKGVLQDVIGNQLEILGPREYIVYKHEVIPDNTSCGNFTTDDPEFDPNCTENNETVTRAIPIGTNFDMTHTLVFSARSNPPRPPVVAFVGGMKYSYTKSPPASTSEPTTLPTMVPTPEPTYTPVEEMSTPALKPPAVGSANATNITDATNATNATNDTETTTTMTTSATTTAEPTASPSPNPTESPTLSPTPLPTAHPGPTPFPTFVPRCNELGYWYSHNGGWRGVVHKKVRKVGKVSSVRECATFCNADVHCKKFHRINAPGQSDYESCYLYHDSGGMEEVTSYLCDAYVKCLSPSHSERPPDAPTSGPTDEPTRETSDPSNFTGEANATIESFAPTPSPTPEYILSVEGYVYFDELVNGRLFQPVLIELCDRFGRCGEEGHWESMEENLSAIYDASIVSYGNGSVSDGSSEYGMLKFEAQLPYFNRRYRVTILAGSVHDVAGKDRGPPDDYSYYIDVGPEVIVLPTDAVAPKLVAAACAPPGIGDISDENASVPSVRSTELRELVLAFNEDIQAGSQFGSDVFLCVGHGRFDVDGSPVCKFGSFADSRDLRITTSSAVIRRQDLFIPFPRELMVDQQLSLLVPRDFLKSLSHVPTEAIEGGDYQLNIAEEDVISPRLEYFIPTSRPEGVVTLFFSEAVQFASREHCLLRQNQCGVPILDLTDPFPLRTPSQAVGTISGNEVLLKMDWQLGTTYSLQIAQKAFADLDGNLGDIQFGSEYASFSIVKELDAPQAAFVPPLWDGFDMKKQLPMGSTSGIYPYDAIVILFDEVVQTGHGRISMRATKDLSCDSMCSGGYDFFEVDASSLNLVSYISHGKQVSAVSITPDGTVFFPDLTFALQVPETVFADTSGNAFASLTSFETFQIAGLLEKDTRAPRLLFVDLGIGSSFDPEFYADSIDLYFTEAVQVSDDTDIFIKLIPSDGGLNCDDGNCKHHGCTKSCGFNPAPASIILPDENLIFNGSKVTIINIQPLPIAYGYSLMVEGGKFKDLAGISAHAFDGRNPSNGCVFKTMMSPTPIIDSRRPQQELIKPSHGERLVPPSTTIQITFDEIVQAGDGSMMIFPHPTGSPIEVPIHSCHFGGRVMTCKPPVVLNQNTHYRVSCVPSVVLDAYSNTAKFDFIPGLRAEAVTYDGVANMSGRTPETTNRNSDDNSTEIREVIVAFTTIDVDYHPPVFADSSGVSFAVRRLKAEPLDPMNNASFVAKGTLMSLTFNEIVQAGTGNIDIMECLADSDSPPSLPSYFLPGLADCANLKKVAAVRIEDTVFDDRSLYAEFDDLKSDRTYSIQTDSDGVVRDIANNPAAQLTSGYRFQVIFEDNLNPEIYYRTPLNDTFTSDDPVTAHIVLYFSEAVQATDAVVTISDGNVTKHIPLNNSNPLQGEVSISDKVATIRPYDEFRYGETVTITIPEGAFLDMYDRPFAGVNGTSYQYITTEPGFFLVKDNNFDPFPGREGAIVHYLNSSLWLFGGRMGPRCLPDAWVSRDGSGKDWTEVKGAESEDVFVQVPQVAYGPSAQDKWDCVYVLGGDCSMNQQYLWKTCSLGADWHLFQLPVVVPWKGATPPPLPEKWLYHAMVIIGGWQLMIVDMAPGQTHGIWRYIDVDMKYLQKINSNPSFAERRDPRLLVTSDSVIYLLGGHLCENVDGIDRSCTDIFNDVWRSLDSGETWTMLTTSYAPYAWNTHARGLGQGSAMVMTHDDHIVVIGGDMPNTPDGYGGYTDVYSSYDVLPGYAYSDELAGSPFVQFTETTPRQFAPSFFFLFREAVQLGSGAISLIDLGQDKALGGTRQNRDKQVDITVNATGHFLLVKPTSELKADRKYLVNVSAGAALNLEGVPRGTMSGQGHDTVHYATSSDDIPPTIADQQTCFCRPVYPQRNSRNVNAFTSVVLVMSEPVQRGQGALHLVPDNIGVEARMDIEDADILEDRVYFGMPRRTRLTSGQTYQIVMPEGLLMDKVGNKVAHDMLGKFTVLSSEHTANNYFMDRKWPPLPKPEPKKKAPAPVAASPCQNRSANKSNGANVTKVANSHDVAKDSPCFDIPPFSDSMYPTCEAQLLYTDNCEARRNGTLVDGYCDKACGVCSETCFDIQPPDHWAHSTCEDQLVNTTNCTSRRKGVNTDGFCARTCGVCAPCFDIPPYDDEMYPTCESQLVNTSNCEARRNGTLEDEYCHKTCGVCKPLALAGRKEVAPNLTQNHTFNTCNTTNISLPPEPEEPPPPLRLLKVYPGNGATDVPAQLRIAVFLFYSKPVRLYVENRNNTVINVTNQYSALVSLDPKTDATFVTAFPEQGVVRIMIPPLNKSHGLNKTMLIKGIRTNIFVPKGAFVDMDGNEAEALTTMFTTLVESKDFKRPEVLMQDPPLGLRGVAREGVNGGLRNIIFWYSEPIIKNAGELQILPPEPPTPFDRRRRAIVIPVTWENVSIQGAKLILPLERAALNEPTMDGEIPRWQLRMPYGMVKDPIRIVASKFHRRRTEGGNMFAVGVSKTFYTIYDGYGPTMNISQNLPPHEEIPSFQLPTSTSVFLQFDEMIQAGRGSVELIPRYLGKAYTIPASTAKLIDRVAFLSPLELLEPGQAYDVHVQADAFQDLNFNDFAGMPGKYTISTVPLINFRRIATDQWNLSNPVLTGMRYGAGAAVGKDNSIFLLGGRDASPHKELKCVTFNEQKCRNTGKGSQLFGISAESLEACATTCESGGCTGGFWHSAMKEEDGTLILPKCELFGGSFSLEDCEPSPYLPGSMRFECTWFPHKVYKHDPSMCREGGMNDLDLDCCGPVEETMCFGNYIRLYITSAERYCGVNKQGLQQYYYACLPPAAHDKHQCAGPQSSECCSSNADDDLETHCNDGFFKAMSTDFRTPYCFKCVRVPIFDRSLKVSTMVSDRSGCGNWDAFQSSGQHRKIIEMERYWENRCGHHCRDHSWCTNWFVNRITSKVLECRLAGPARCDQNRNSMWKFYSFNRGYWDYLTGVPDIIYERGPDLLGPTGSHRYLNDVWKFETRRHINCAMAFIEAETCSELHHKNPRCISDPTSPPWGRGYSLGYAVEKETVWRPPSKLGTQCKQSPTFYPAKTEFGDVIAQRNVACPCPLCIDPPGPPEAMPPFMINYSYFEAYTLVSAAHETRPMLCNSGRYPTDNFRCKYYERHVGRYELPFPRCMNLTCKDPPDSNAIHMFAVFDTWRSTNKLDCTKLTPENVMPHNGKCAILCAPGWQAHGSFYCDQGQYRHPECTRQRCIPAPASHGKLLCHPPGISESEKFWPSGKPKRKKWTPQPEMGSECMLLCDAGYNASVGDVLCTTQSLEPENPPRYQADEHTAEVVPLCTPTYCGPFLHTLGASIQYGLGTHVMGDSATVTCEPGFEVWSTMGMLLLCGPLLDKPGEFQVEWQYNLTRARAGPPCVKIGMRIEEIVELQAYVAFDLAMPKDKKIEDLICTNATFAVGLRVAVSVSLVAGSAEGGISYNSVQDVNVTDVCGGTVVSFGGARLNRKVGFEDPDDELRLASEVTKNVLSEEAASSGADPARMLANTDSTGATKLVEPVQYRSITTGFTVRCDDILEAETIRRMLANEPQKVVFARVFGLVMGHVTGLHVISIDVGKLVTKSEYSTVAPTTAPPTTVATTTAPAAIRTSAACRRFRFGERMVSFALPLLLTGFFKLYISSRVDT